MWVPIKIFKGFVRFNMSSELSLVHPIFHVSMLRKCIGNPESIIPIEGLGMEENITCEVVPVEILDH